MMLSSDILARLWRMNVRTGYSISLNEFELWRKTKGNDLCEKIKNVFGFLNCEEKDGFYFIENKIVKKEWLHVYLYDILRDECDVECALQLTKPIKEWTGGKGKKFAVYFERKGECLFMHVIYRTNLYEGYFEDLYNTDGEYITACSGEVFKCDGKFNLKLIKRMSISYLLGEVDFNDIKNAYNELYNRMIELMGE